MCKWLLAKLAILRRKWMSHVDVVALEKLVELAGGGLAVTTEGRDVVYRTILQIDGDVIQKCEISPEARPEYTDLVWVNHLERVNNNLGSVREVVDHLVQNMVRAVSAGLALLGIGTVYSLGSDNPLEVTVENAIYALFGGVPGLIFLRFGKRVTAIAFRRVLGSRLESISARLTDESLAAQ